MFLRVIFFLSLFFQVQAKGEPFLLLTVPKSGTHLVHNLITEMTGRTKNFVHSPYQIGVLDHNVKYFSAHFKYKFDPESFTRLHPKYKYLINVRDPRDVCVSSVFYYHLVLDYLMGKNANFDDRLSFTIKYTTLNNFFGVLVHFERALYAIKHSNALVVRFEDLVGPHGGGTLESQISTIKQVGQLFNMQISDEEAIAIGESIYGHSDTFRSGQIGSWRKHFTENHIRQFKQSGLQKVLVELGYEKDDQW